MEKTSFPLYWPEGRPRIASSKDRTFPVGFAEARDEALREIRLLGGSEMILSTNVPLKRDGLPQSMPLGKSLPDPGVAVYFKRKGKELCFACDCWAHVQDNMQAIAKTISALRGIARWGTGDMMEAAFHGFRQLPESTAGSWHRVLGVPINAGPQQIRDAYRGLVKKFHPDNKETGDAERFRQIQATWDECQRDRRV